MAIYDELFDEVHVQSGAHWPVQCSTDCCFPGNALFIDVTIRECTTPNFAAHKAQINIFPRNYQVLAA